MINEILDNIQRRVGDAFQWIFDPLWKWYIIGILIFAACAAISIFVPFKWVRAGLGAFLVLVGAFILGGRTMHGQMKDEVRRAREREDEAKRQRREERGSGGGPFGGLFGG